MANRNILLHCHFFKNGGSTIDWALKRNFGETFYENKSQFYSVEEWEAYLTDLVIRNSYSVVSSHIFSVRPPKIEGLSFFPIAMLRHPIERVTSVAAFEKKQNYVDTYGMPQDSELNLQKYVEHFIKDGTSATIRNIHTLRLAGRSNGCPVTEQDFVIALETLRQCPTIGLVDFFDESMVLFEEILRPAFPHLDLSYIIQNVNQVESSVSERIQCLAMELGETLYNKLVKANKTDLKLYDYAKVKFNERCLSIPHFYDKLSNFKARCSEQQRNLKN